MNIEADYYLPGNATPSGKFDYKLLLNRVGGAVQRFWALVLVWAGIVAVTAVLVSWKYTTYTWHAKASLLYATLPIPENQKDLYSQPDLKTLLGIAVTQPTVDTLCTEFGLPEAAKYLEKNLEVTNPPGTRVIQLSLKWGESAQAQALLQRYIELFGLQVADLRQRKIDGHIVDFNKSLHDEIQRWEQARDKLQVFHRKQGLTSLKQNQIAQAADLIALKTALDQAIRNQSSTQAQLTQLTEHLKTLRATAIKEEADSKQFEAAEETVADNRRRQDRLRELISDAKRLEETKAMLDVKLREADRIRPLVMQGIKTRGEYDRLMGEIGVLQTRIVDSDKIIAWKKELENIDKVVVPKGKSKSQGSPIIQQTLFRQLELQLQMTGYQHEINQLKLAIEKKEQDIEKLAQLTQQSESLAHQVEMTDAQVQRVQGQVAALKQLRELGPNDFVVINPPATGLHPVSSSKKILLAGIIGGGLVFGFLLVFAYDYWLFTRTPDGLAQRIGLPVLTRVKIPQDDVGIQQISTREPKHPIRSLALQIRQHTEHPGSIILFSPTAQMTQLIPCLNALAGCLARRDERVLVLDARTHEPVQETVGLRDFLAFECDEPEMIIHRSNSFGIDHIPAGRSVIESDALATHRMKDLMDFLQERYTIILVLGPSLEEPVDLSILTAMAEILIIMTCKAPVIPKLAHHTLEILKGLDAPTLGQIILVEEKTSQKPLAPRFVPC